MSSDGPDMTSADAQAFAREVYEDTFAATESEIWLDGVRHVPGIVVEDVGVVEVHGGRLLVGGLTFPSRGGYPDGRYTVQVMLAQLELFRRFDADGSLVALARVVLTANPPVRWEVARGLASAERGASGEMHESARIRVDAGALTIAHPGHDDAMRALRRAHGANDFDDIIALAAKGTAGVTFEAAPRASRWGAYRLNGLAAVSMRAGIGDGTYRLMVGLDDGGAPCRLVVDFEVLG